MASSKFHTIPVTLTDEQFENLRDVSLALDLQDDEFVHLAVNSRVDETMSALNGLKQQLGSTSDDEEASQPLEHHDALTASREARKIIDPVYKDFMERIERDMERAELEPQDEAEKQKSRWF